MAQQHHIGLKLDVMHQILYDDRYRDGKQAELFCERTVASWSPCWVLCKHLLLIIFL